MLFDRVVILDNYKVSRCNQDLPKMEVVLDGIWWFSLLLLKVGWNTNESFLYTRNGLQQIMIINLFFLLSHVVILDPRSPLILKKRAITLRTLWTGSDLQVLQIEVRFDEPVDTLEDKRMKVVGRMVAVRLLKWKRGEDLKAIYQPGPQGRLSHPSGAKTLLYTQHQHPSFRMLRSFLLKMMTPTSVKELELQKASYLTYGSSGEKWLSKHVEGINPWSYKVQYS